MTPKQETILNVSLGVLFFLILASFCWIMGYSFGIPLLFVLLGVHLYFLHKADRKLFLHLGLLLTLLLFLSHFITQYSPLSYYYIPVASIAMLTMLLFNDLSLTFVMALGGSLLVSITLGGDFSMMLNFFFGSLTGAYFVRDARTRGQLITAGVFVSFVHVMCLFAFNPSASFILAPNFKEQYLFPLLANGLISSLIVAATLKIFEYIFGVLTNYSLLELSDFNQPLLKRMILEAPGSYHHSLVVSNLAEAASDAIGANALLTRVGAYYHDIGKMVKPEYFTENQLMGGNKHDNIEPSVSRLVILNHVKEGIELAKKNKLNPIIIDFIPQHHGTGLMYYFYQKSIEIAEDNEEINEEDYRYPGPKPQRRETAIVLLADSVEGATRAIDEPNPNKIEATVKKIINNKFIDGQLDECNLTLKEIDKISSTFTRILSAMYHGRVKYPERSTSKNGSTVKKPSEKNSPQSPQNNQDSQSNS